MTIKVQITFEHKHPMLNDVVVNGLEVPFEALTIGDLTNRIAETEAHLSRITGLVVKIETGAE